MYQKEPFVLCVPRTPPGDLVTEINAHLLRFWGAGDRRKVAPLNDALAIWSEFVGWRKEMRAVVPARLCDGNYNILSGMADTDADPVMIYIPYPFNTPFEDLVHTFYHEVGHVWVAWAREKYEEIVVDDYASRCIGAVAQHPALLSNLIQGVDGVEDWRVPNSGAYKQRCKNVRM